MGITPAQLNNRNVRPIWAAGVCAVGEGELERAAVRYRNAERERNGRIPRSSTASASACLMSTQLRASVSEKCVDMSELATDWLAAVSM